MCASHSKQPNRGNPCHCDSLPKYHAVICHRKIHDVRSSRRKYAVHVMSILVVCCKSYYCLADFMRSERAFILSEVRKSKKNGEKKFVDCFGQTKTKKEQKIRNKPNENFAS